MSEPPDEQWRGGAPSGWDAAPEQSYGPAGWDTGSVSSGYGAPHASRTPVGFWIRFLSALVDGIVLGIAGTVIAALTGTRSQTLSTLLGAVYFTYLHSSSGQTLGNRLTGLRVADVDTGGNLDAVRAFLRWLVSIVSGIPFALGFLWMLWDPDRQTWHDKIARSNVYRAR